MKAPSPAPVSPIVREFPDNAGLVLRISVFFDVTTRALTGITIFRDANCRWNKILVGLGPDGTPDTTTKSVTVPAGTTVLTAGQLNVLANNGLATVEDFLALQITATAA